MLFCSAFIHICVGKISFHLLKSSHWNKTLCVCCNQQVFKKASYVTMKGSVYLTEKNIKACQITKQT